MTEESPADDNEEAREEQVTRFEVLSGGTLQRAEFSKPRIRKNLYWIADSWQESPKQLISAFIDCQPMVWALHRVYEEYRGDIEFELENLQDAEEEDQGQVSALRAKLESLPADPEKGLEGWLQRIDADYFADVIVPYLNRWLAQPPDWIGEEDYLPETASAEGMALAYFDSLETETLELLGVRIIDGDHPGSSYCAAELHKDIDEANVIAASLGLQIRFVQGTG